MFNFRDLSIGILMDKKFPYKHGKYFTIREVDIPAILICLVPIKR